MGTWRDMRATKEDFNKVFDVVVEQIEGSLNPEKANERPKTFEQFRQNVKSYLDISRKWQQDARSRKAWDESAPVAELKKHLEPEIKELIRHQRGNFMVEGTRFQKYKKSGEENKGQFRYVKLHPNHKTIYVGDWNSEKSVPTIEDLEPWLQISDIELFTMGDCPFIKNMKKETQNALSSRALSLQLQGGENTSLDLVAPDIKFGNLFGSFLKTIQLICYPPFVNGYKVNSIIKLESIIQNVFVCYKRRRCLNFCSLLISENEAKRYLSCAKL